MFRLLVEIFKREDLLQQAYETSVEMLKIDAKMFRAAYQSLAKEGTVDIDIYSLDNEINEDQREVRRKVVAHLATSSTRDIVFGLMLVSIIIDIERIGDYTKNIMDLALSHPDKLNYYQFKEMIEKTEKQVDNRFSQLIKAFEKSDETIGKELMINHKEINEVCNHIIDELINKDDLGIPAKDSAALALHVRYLKRISAHISNVASGMVNTFDNIGFNR